MTSSVGEEPTNPPPEGDDIEQVAPEEVRTGTSQSAEEAAENAEEGQNRTAKESEGDGN